MMFVILRFPNYRQNINYELYNQLIKYLSQNNYQDVAKEAQILLRNN